VTGQPFASLVAPLSFRYRADDAELGAAGGELSHVQIAQRTSSGWIGLGCVADVAARALGCDAPNGGDFASW
jgi:hypothetical protein